MGMRLFLLRGNPLLGFSSFTEFLDLPHIFQSKYSVLPRRSIKMQYLVALKRSNNFESLDISKQELRCIDQKINWIIFLLIYYYYYYLIINNTGYKCIIYRFS